MSSKILWSSPGKIESFLSIIGTMDSEDARNFQQAVNAQALEIATLKEQIADLQREVRLVDSELPWFAVSMKSAEETKKDLKRIYGAFPEAFRWLTNAPENIDSQERNWITLYFQEHNINTHLRGIVAGIQKTLDNL
jgi:hypothetical protein